ncbi:MAG: TerB family tellurite resistance protein [Polyangiaceae bacterium]
MNQDPRTLLGVISELASVAGDKRSVFALAALHFGSMPEPEATLPTGFDERAARLFEAILESAYLVAVADGTFDAEEEAVFAHIVALASSGCVPKEALSMLLDEFRTELARQGIDARIASIARALGNPEQAEEVLRVATLLGIASEGLAPEESVVLHKLATACNLPKSAVETAISRAQAVLARAHEPIPS